MKKTFVLFMIVAALGMMSCDGNPQPGKETPSAVASLKGCDMAAFEDGKVTFYNSSTNTFVPFTAEKDYVVTGFFCSENEFYYTVSVDDELYLKMVDISAETPAPVQLIDWELKLSDCYDKSCEKCASMDYYDGDPDVKMVGIEYNMGEMCKGFQDNKYYLIDKQTISDGWPEGVDDSYYIQQAVIDDQHFISLPKEEGSDEKYFYYVPNSVTLYSSEEEMAKDWVCLSDKINFHEGKYSGYDAEPDFTNLGFSPKADCVAYAAIMEWGRGGRGPLCFATLDGKVQKLLAYDACYGWLGNNKLAFSDEEGIKTIDSDGTITKLTSGNWFVTLH